MPHRSLFAIPFALALLVAVPTLRFGYVHDDFSLIAGNRDLASPGGWSALAASPLERWMGPGYPFYRPLAMLSYRATPAAPDPAPHHAVNALAHATTTAAVFALATSLGEPPRTALLAAALFAVHPAHAEAVAWLSARADLLAALFALLAWVATLRASSGYARALLAATLYVAALAAKESAAALPLAIVASAAPAAARWRQAGFFALALCAWLGLRALVVPGGAPALSHPLLRETLPTQARVLAALTADIAGQLAGAGTGRLDYSLARFAAAPLDAACARNALALTLLVAVALVDVRRSGLARASPWLLGLLASFLPLLANLTRPTTALFALRYLYLPSAFLCLGLARSAARAPIALAVLILLFALRFESALPPFADPVALWSHELAVSPGWPVASHNLANALLAVARERIVHGDRAAGESVLLRAFALAPDTPRLAANLGFFYLSSEKPERARPYLEEALRLDPLDRASRENLRLATGRSTR